MAMATLTLPYEIWEEIISLNPPHLLLSIALTCRGLHDISRSLLYRTVYFLGTSVKGLDYATTRSRCMGIEEEQDWLFNPLYSSRIYNLSRFIQTIRNNKSLGNHVRGVSFEWDDTVDAIDLKDIESILGLLKPSVKNLHLGPSTFEIDWSFLDGVTSFSISRQSMDILEEAILS